MHKISFFTKYLFLMSLFFGAFLSAGGSMSATKYFNYLHDVPVMQGLVVLEEQSTMFDKPEGRIVVQIARATDVSEKQISAFYAATLPSLGWKQIADNVYYREQERLTLTFQKNRGGILVKFFVSPKFDR